MRTFLLSLASLAMLVACTSPAIVQGIVDDVRIDGGALDAAAADGVSADSGAAVDSMSDALEVDTGSSEGGFGYPCTTNSDCNSEFCVPTSEGDQCTKTCDSECPEGWACRPVGGESDVTYICLPEHINLCRPCLTNADCTGALGGVSLGSRCINYPEHGWFCGSACDKTTCPSGYTCKDVEDKEGDSSAQCVADAGKCECSPYFIALGAETWCTVSNDAGQCMGTIKCTADGMTACDAATPEPEICDLKDNDCDEAIDEDVPEEECAGEANDWGACSGTATCQDGEMVCDAGAAAEELCDGVDNDCDGTSDNGFSDLDADGTADCVDEDDDGDGVDDATDNCPAVANPEQIDTDGDLAGDACDDDDDGDQVADEDDAAPLDPKICGLDSDLDGCDDCAEGAGPAPENDGLDTDGDGTCDLGDSDDDGDGCEDAVDAAPLVPSPDTDKDGLSDDCDLDDDNDGIVDVLDSAPLDPTVCGFDDDADTCDDCASGVNDPANDGVDTDGDGLCDAGDLDDDQDGVNDDADTDPLDPLICADVDQDGCDDCSGGQGPNTEDDGPDNDADGSCDLGDADDDNDGCLDPDDEAPFSASGDTDEDGSADDCDADDDGDTVEDGEDADPLNPNVCADSDLDTCDDCTSGTFNPAADGLDSDGDGACDAGDTDDDNDGTLDVSDCKPLDKATTKCHEKHCKDIKAKYPQSSSGAYTIDVDGDNKGQAPQKVYCDMVTHGGGWTALLNPSQAPNGKPFALGASVSYSASCGNCTSNFLNVAGGWYQAGIYRCGKCTASATVSWSNVLGATQVMYVAYAHGISGVSMTLNGANGHTHTGCGPQQRFASANGGTCTPNNCAGGAFLKAQTPAVFGLNGSLSLKVQGTSNHVNVFNQGHPCWNFTGWGGGGTITKLMVR